MAHSAGPLSLFGLDLGKVWRNFRQGWCEALEWPLFAWLTPSEPVRVRMPDGRQVVYQGTRPPAVGVRAPERSAQALVLDEDATLVRQLVLPDLVAEDLRAAIELDVIANTPFPFEQTVWGWRSVRRADGHLDLTLVLAARPHVIERITAAGFDLAQPPEIWAMPDSGEAVVLRGFGESVRLRRLVRQRMQIIAAVFFAGLSLLALIAAPFMLEREQVFDAQAQYAKLMQETAAVVAQREALVQAAQRVQAIHGSLQTRPDLARLLDVLTATLPDTAYLNRLEVAGNTVRIGGVALNAAELIAALGQTPGIEAVRTPGAITRAPDGRETFSIEFNWGNVNAVQASPDVPQAGATALGGGR